MHDIILQHHINKSYFSGGGDKHLNMMKVEAYVAVEIAQGPHLVEDTVKDGLYGFRNIVCWQNGDLQLSGNPRVKRFWTGSISEDNPGENLVETETGKRKLSESPKPKTHYPCLNPQTCPFAWCKAKEKKPQDSPGESDKPDNKVERTRGSKRPLENVESTSPKKDRKKAKKARSSWTDRELLEWL